MLNMYEFRKVGQLEKQPMVYQAATHGSGRMTFGCWLALVVHLEGILTCTAGGHGTHSFCNFTINEVVKNGNLLINCTGATENMNVEREGLVNFALWTLLLTIWQSEK